MTDKHTDEKASDKPELPHSFQRSEILTKGAMHPLCAQCGLSEEAGTHKQSNAVNYAGMDWTGDATLLARFKQSAQPQAKHSPLPWKWNEMATIETQDNQTCIASLRHRDWPESCNVDNETLVANARLIVASVNHADKLAEALRDLRSRVVAEKPDCLNTTKADEALANWEGAK